MISYFHKGNENFPAVFACYPVADYKIFKINPRVVNKHWKRKKKNKLRLNCFQRFYAGVLKKDLKTILPEAGDQSKELERFFPMYGGRFFLENYDTSKTIF